MEYLLHSRAVYLRHLSIQLKAYTRFPRRFASDGRDNDSHAAYAGAAWLQRADRNANWRQLRNEYWGLFAIVGAFLFSHIAVQVAFLRSEEHTSELQSLRHLV